MQDVLAKSAVTLTAHAARCAAPLVSDRAFQRDMAAYGVERARLTCVAGHSVYVGAPPPELSRHQPLIKGRARVARRKRLEGRQ